MSICFMRKLLCSLVFACTLERFNKRNLTWLTAEATGFKVTWQLFVRYFIS